MAELRQLQRKLDSAKALGNVVGALRNLAAIYVRRAESAVKAVRPYSEVVETGLGVLLGRLESDTAAPALVSSRRSAAVVFAGDQGLCGAFNERVAQAALAFREGKSGDVAFVCIGHRGAEILARNGVWPVLTVSSPTSLEGIKAQAPRLAADVYEQYSKAGADELHFIYNAPQGMGHFKEQTRRVLPPGRDLLAGGGAAAYRYGPILTAAPEDLLGPFIEEYFFIQLCRALLESHCSENGARLLAMTSAAGNIDERSAELTHAFHTERQHAITAELLDVVGGAEALGRGADGA